MPRLRLIEPETTPAEKENYSPFFSIQRNNRTVPAVFTKVVEAPKYLPANQTEPILTSPAKAPAR